MEIEDNQTQPQEVQAIKPQTKQKIKKLSKSKSKKDKNKFGIFKCSFINYKPSKILEMAFNENTKLIAVGRETCFIEIWKTNSWAIIAKYSLEKDYIIKKILWLDNEHFIVGCLNGYILKYSLNSLIPQAKYLSQGGAIFDMCLNQNKTLLMSQFDGCLRSYILFPNPDEIDQFQIKLDQVSRNFSQIVVSCCWDNDNPSEFFGSFQDGLIRKFTNFASVSLTIKQQIINKIQIFAWKILSLPNKILVTGTNNGHIQFYETNFGTCIKTFNTHEADILNIIMSQNKRIIYATGSDSKIVSIEQLSQDNQGQNWQLTSQDRGQSHDINALQIINEKTLISGGVSTDICIYKLKNGRFIDRNLAEQNSKNNKEIQNNEIKLRHISAFPQNEFIFSTTIKETAFILVQKQFSIEYWKFSKTTKEIEFNFEIATNQFPVLCANLQNLGKYFAYSTEINTKLYKICKNNQIVLIQELEASQSLEFSNSFNQSFLLYITLDSKIVGFNLATKVKFEIITDLPQTIYKKENAVETIYQYSELSESNQFFAVGSKLQNQIIVFYDIFKFKKDKQQINDQQELFVLPTLEMNTTFMSFKINEDSHQLIVVYDNNKFAIFNLKEKCQTFWSQQNFLKLPKNYLQRYNKVQGIVISQSDQKRLLFYTNYYYVLVLLNQKCPTFCRILKNYQGEERQNFDLIYFQKPILSLNYCEDNQYLLFENQWEQMLEGMQNPINAKKFGL